MLFKTTIKLAEFSEITASTNFISITPTLKRIEEKHIVPILGKELYEELDGDYTASASESELSDELEALLTKCRQLIGAYLGFYFAPIAEVKFSDSGVRRSETNSEKTAYQYQVAQFREACLRNGEQETESLLEFLEENQADYSSWVDSEAFKSYKKLFIKSGKEFDDNFSSASPQRNYWAMRSKMYDVEEQVIRKALGDELFEDLKGKDQTGTPALSTYEKQLLVMLKKSIAYFTVAFSIPYLPIRIDSHGITVAAMGARTSRDELASRQTASDKQISSLILACNDSGQSWLKQAIEHLDKNAEEFEYWTAPDPDADPADDGNSTNTSSF